MADVKFLRLWDVYSPLLTPTQREISDMHFNLDLTVSEIAEQKGISRQGVSECLASAKKQLVEYERKLGFSRLLREGDLRLSIILTSGCRWAVDFAAAHPEFSKDVARLKGILQGDYSAEAEDLCEKLEGGVDADEDEDVIETEEESKAHAAAVEAETDANAAVEAEKKE